MPSTKKTIDAPVWVWPLLPAADTRYTVLNGTTAYRGQTHALDRGTITLVQLRLAGCWRLVYTTSSSASAWGRGDTDPYGHLHTRLCKFFNLRSAYDVRLDSAATRALSWRQHNYGRYNSGGLAIGRRAHTVLGDHNQLASVFSLANLDLRAQTARWCWWWGVVCHNWIAVSETDETVWHVSAAGVRQIDGGLTADALVHTLPARGLFDAVPRRSQRKTIMVEDLDVGLIDLINQEAEMPHSWHMGRDQQWAGLINIDAAGRAHCTQSEGASIGIDLDNALPHTPVLPGMKSAYSTMLARLDRLGSAFEGKTRIFDCVGDRARVKYLRGLLPPNSSISVVEHR